MKILVFALAACSIALGAAPCVAQDSGRTVLQDTLYGALTGALVGAAVMAFTDDPGDHLEYIGYGAASGTLAGAAFGLWEATAWTTVENGRVRMAMPSFQAAPVKVDAPFKAFKAWADFLRVRF
ncbi:MAG: hypothetical protein KKA60_03230 [Proteobacteria bacterium]|nr:hypothetical protein [Pseudomonadota bacterium]